MKYFRTKEFECKCGQCSMPSEVQANIDALVTNVLDPLREAYGKPIYVNSGYRCASTMPLLAVCRRVSTRLARPQTFTVPITLPWFASSSSKAISTR